LKAVVKIFDDKYFTAPNAQDTVRLMARNNTRGFSGMLDFIGCIHWRWDKCTTTWRGAYSWHKDGSTMILDVVALQDVWIWHASFRLPDSLKDINVLSRSPLFQCMTSVTAP
jgi:hypothetical protein